MSCPASDYKQFQEIRVEEEKIKEAYRQEQYNRLHKAVWTAHRQILDERKANIETARNERRSERAKKKLEKKSRLEQMADGIDMDEITRQGSQGSQGMSSKKNTGLQDLNSFNLNDAVNAVSTVAALASLFDFKKFIRDILLTVECVKFADYLDIFGDDEYLNTKTDIKEDVVAFIEFRNKNRELSIPDGIDAFSDFLPDHKALIDRIKNLSDEEIIKGTPPYCKFVQKMCINGNKLHTLLEDKIALLTKQSSIPYIETFKEVWTELEKILKVESVLATDLINTIIQTMHKSEIPDTKELWAKAIKDIDPSLIDTITSDINTILNQGINNPDELLSLAKEQSKNSVYFGMAGGRLTIRLKGRRIMTARKTVD